MLTGQARFLCSPFRLPGTECAPAGPPSPSGPLVLPSASHLPPARPSAQPGLILHPGCVHQGQSSLLSPHWGGWAGGEGLWGGARENPVRTSSCL